ncbi:MAG: hypothetical protein EKK49_07530 [Rhodocyclaceae bacterium]|nr:MAG: hypothetical protein EKK49_07530 [Rhodocyclaceae bacterium]
MIVTTPISRRRFALLLGTAVGATVLGGCAGLSLGLKKPDVKVAGIRLLDAGLFEQRFIVSLRITNPNNAEIPIEGLNFNVDINGQPFAHGVSNQPVVVPRLGEAVLEVTATTGLDKLLRQFGELGRGRDRVDYRIRGRLVTGNLGGFDFDKSGEVAFPKILGGSNGPKTEPTPDKGPSESF